MCFIQVEKLSPAKAEDQKQKGPDVVKSNAIHPHLFFYISFLLQSILKNCLFLVEISPFLPHPRMLVVFCATKVCFPVVC